MAALPSRGMNWAKEWRRNDRADSGGHKVRQGCQDHSTARREPRRSGRPFALWPAAVRKLARASKRLLLSTSLRTGRARILLRMRGVKV
jgi:hypothetical protein